MITYNHARFVGDAIESALMQETSFDYEIVIGEDCSRDGTREIVTSFAKRYPEKIRPLFPPINIGASENFMRTFHACRGEYIATLDGDDYWSSPQKLQMQVEFLDGHPECVGCFHAVKRVWEGTGKWEIYYPKGRKKAYGFADYADGVIASHCSTMFRRGVLGKLPGWYQNHSGDRQLQVLHAEHGPMGYIDEVLAVYRIHSGGVWTSRYGADEEKRLRLAIEVQEALQSRHVAPYAALFDRHKYELYYWLAHAMCDRGDRSAAHDYVKYCLRECGYDSRVAASEPLKIYLHMYGSPMYHFLRAVKRKLLGRIHQATGHASND